MYFITGEPGILLIRHMKAIKWQNLWRYMFRLIQIAIFGPTSKTSFSCNVTGVWNSLIFKISLQFQVLVKIGQYSAIYMNS